MFARNSPIGIVGLIYGCYPADSDAHLTDETREVRRIRITREEVQAAMNSVFAMCVLDVFDDDTHARI